MTRFRRAGLPLLVLLFPPYADACDGLVVTGAWVREPPPGMAMTAAYFTVENHGGERRTLTGLHSEEFESAMLHQTVQEDGRASMRHLGEVALAPGARLIAAPGGIHAMLAGPRVTLAAGVDIHLDLRCAGDTTLPFVAPVRRSAPDAP